MLEIGSRTIAVDGVTVFADHADPDQFWYLPGPVRLARRPEDNRADFTLIKYAGVQDGNLDGGGFLTFKANLHLNATTRRRIMGRISRLASGRPKLAPVPFDEGTVEAIALNLQGPGGTSAPLDDNGAFTAVEAIRGATAPSLHGDNDAAFSLTLSKEGAIILEKSFEDGGTPVGVIYSLRYTGLRPSLEVEISVDMKRVYDHFSAALQAQYAMVSAGIEAGLEKLRQDGVIEIKVINFSTSADQEEKIKWALEFFRDKLLNEWFTPTLTPGQFKGGLAKAENLSTVASRAEQLRPKRRTPGADDGRPTRPPGERPATGPTPVRGVQEPAGVVANVSTEEQVGGRGQSPPVSNPPADRATVGLSFPAPRLPNAANQVLSNQGGNMAGFGASFKLKFIRQDELKTLRLRYTRAEAVQRTYAPQGFFGLLSEDLDEASHFIEVDLDHPFFREFEVRVEAPFDREPVELVSTQIELEYGDPSDPTRHRREDFVFDAEDPGVKQWTVQSLPNELDYTHRVQFHFDPQSDWVGERSSYELPAITTQDRTLLVHPFDHLGFLQVEVNCDDIDWTTVASVTVELDIDSAGWVQQRAMHFDQDRPESQHWKLRLDDKSANAYNYRATYRLRDGDELAGERTIVPSGASRVAIPNPFRRHEIEFLPLWDQSAYRFVFIDVEYVDPDNDHDQEMRLSFPGAGFDSRKVTLQLIDPAVKAFRYRATFVGNDQSLTREEFKTTEETLIGIFDPIGSDGGDQ